jgi:hypothetical protein
MKTYTRFTNVFDDGSGMRYLSGTIFETAEAALKAQSNKRLKGIPVGVARVTWQDKNAKSEWTLKR